MRRSIALTALVAFFALATAQDVFSPARIYTVGEKDVYGLSMKMATGQYDVSIVGKLSYLTKKLHENGDADLESNAYDVVMNVMGQEMKQPGGDVTIRRYNKFGAAIEKGVSKDKRQPIFMKFLTYRPATPMKVGQAVKIDEVLDDEAKTQVKGTAKLDSLIDGVAKITSVLDVTQSKTKKPTHFESVGYYDAKSSKLNRAESKLTNVDASEMEGMPPVNSITVVVEREK
ncbi:MAG: hypothetical protein H7Y17_13715 [Chlorobia bacterium]|nr:hypothetical protein [Fimbriimonadaceae bacterium]